MSCLSEIDGVQVDCHTFARASSLPHPICCAPFSRSRLSNSDMAAAMDLSDVMGADVAALYTAYGQRHEGRARGREFESSATGRGRRGEERRADDTDHVCFGVSRQAVRFVQQSGCHRRGEWHRRRPQPGRRVARDLPLCACSRSSWLALASRLSRRAARSR